MDNKIPFKKLDKKTIEINERLLYDKVLFYPSWRN